MDGRRRSWYRFLVARRAPPRLILASALGLALLGGAPRAGAQGAPAGPVQSSPSGSQGEPAKPLDVPAPILVPEPVVEPPPRRVEALPRPQPLRRMRLELVVGGAGLLASVWAADRLLARDLSLDWPSWLPLVGPWYLVAEQQRQTTPNGAVTAFLALDGIAQAAGATMVVLGLVLRKERLVIRLPAAPAASLRVGGPGALTLTF